MSYIKGKWANAACDLTDWLKREMNISACVGYALNPKKRGNELHVECKDAVDVSRVPKQWNGFDLVATPYTPPDIVCRR